MNNLQIKTNEKALKFITTFIFALFGFMAFGSLIGNILFHTLITNMNRALISSDPAFRQEWIFLGLINLILLIIFLSILLLARGFRQRKKWTRIPLVCLLIISSLSSIPGFFLQWRSLIKKIISGEAKFDMSNPLEWVSYRPLFIGGFLILALCGVNIYIIIKLLKCKVEND